MGTLTLQEIECPTCQGAGYHYTHANGDGSGPKCERCYGQGVIEAPRVLPLQLRRLSGPVHGLRKTLTDSAPVTIPSQTLVNVITVYEGHALVRYLGEVKCESCRGVGYECADCDGSGYGEDEEIVADVEAGELARMSAVRTTRQIHDGMERRGGFESEVNRG